VLLQRPSERVKIATLVLLAGVGGYVDAVSYLGLGRVFTAAMTGNSVLLALAVAQRDWSAALRSAVALLGFVGGVALGQLVVGRYEARAHWPRAAGAGLMLETGLLMVLAAGWYLAGPQPNGWLAHLSIAASALAMGTQSATARYLDVAAVSTTYVTGTLTSLTSGTIEWLRSPRRARQPAVPTPKNAAQTVAVHGPALPAVAWVVYVVGALVGGLAVLTASVLAVLPAVLVVAILALLDRRADP
jgi:uncharacterized membrane protein YoaK (UPF0700 family)